MRLFVRLGRRHAARGAQLACDRLAALHAANIHPAAIASLERAAILEEDAARMLKKHRDEVKGQASSRGSPKEGGAKAAGKSAKASARAKAAGSSPTSEKTVAATPEKSSGKKEAPTSSSSPRAAAVDGKSKPEKGKTAAKETGSKATTSEAKAKDVVEPADSTSGKPSEQPKKDRQSKERMSKDRFGIAPAAATKDAGSSDVLRVVRRQHLLLLAAREEATVEQAAPSAAPTPPLQRRQRLGAHRRLRLLLEPRPQRMLAAVTRSSSRQQ